MPRRQCGLCQIMASGHGARSRTANPRAHTGPGRGARNQYHKVSLILHCGLRVAVRPKNIMTRGPEAVGQVRHEGAIDGGPVR